MSVNIAIQRKDNYRQIMQFFGVLKNVEIENKENVKIRKVYKYVYITFNLVICMVDVETATMSERGQIIIPKGIREFMRAEENTTFTIMPLDKDTIVMKRLNKLKLLEEFRNIGKHIKKRLSSEEIQDEILNYRRSKHR